MGCFNDMGKQLISRNQRVNPMITEINPTKVQFNMGHRISHEFMGCVSGYSHLPEPNESVKEKKEYCGFERVKKEPIAGILPTITNYHDSDPKQGTESLVGIKIAEDPERLKRRLDKFKLLPVITKVQADDQSIESETNSSPQHDDDMKYSNYSPQRPIRRRKWAS